MADGRRHARCRAAHGRARGDGTIRETEYVHGERGVAVTRFRRIVDGGRPSRRPASAALSTARHYYNLYFRHNRAGHKIHAKRAMHRRPMRFRGSFRIRTRRNVAHRPPCPTKTALKDGSKREKTRTSRPANVKLCREAAARGTHERAKARHGPALRAEISEQTVLRRERVSSALSLSCE